jgi:hypothetical protein
LCTSAELYPERDVHVWFSDEVDGPRNKTIGGVAFDVTREAVSFLYTASDSQPPIRKDVLSYNLNTDLGGYRDYSYTLTLPANQAAETATKTLFLKYRYLIANGSEVESSLEVPLNLQVKPSFDLRLADSGGTTGEIDLGTFSGTTATHSLQLKIGANVPYKISMQSTQGGVLRRTTMCGIKMAETTDPAERISYSASLDSQVISPLDPLLRDQTTLAQSGLRISLPFSVTVPSFNPIERRAGQYCDVITLKIEPKS